MKRLTSVIYLSAAFLAALLFCGSPGFAQKSGGASAPRGAAPAPPGYDNLDLRNLFGMLGIEVYKYPVKAAPGATFALNFIVEEYENGVVKQSIDWQQTLKSRLAPGTNMAPFLDTVGVAGEWVRVYAQRNVPGQFTFRFGTDGILKSATFPLDTATYPQSASYSAGTPKFAMGQKTPLLVHYMQKRGKTMVPFPTGKPLADVIKAYPRMFVVYAQPVQIGVAAGGGTSSDPRTNRQKTPSK